MSDQQLSALIGTIYDAALDPTLWTDALEQASQFVGGCGASIYSKDSVSRTVDISHRFGVEDKFRLNYVDEYVKLDPTTPGFFFFGVEEIVTIRDILPYDELLDTRFYKEWVQPQRWVDMVTAILEKSTTSYAVLTVFRHERDGMADDGARHRMKLLMPHVRRAVLIGKTIQLNRAEAATLADTLDSLSAAMFLVDATGRLLQANVSGHALIADASVVRAAGGRLVANDACSDNLLRDALAATQNGDDSLGTRGISLPLPAPDNTHYVAHILPLTAGARRQAGIGYAATAAVFVRKTQLETPPAPEVIAKLYGLTPSELRVLLAVFESGGVSDVAEALGISEATAKTHLRRLFDKTGTRRQADLVKLVAGFSGSTR